MQATKLLIVTAVLSFATLLPPLLPLLPLLLAEAVLATPPEALPMLPRGVRAVAPLGFPYATPSPFLFCVFHHDRYPAGDAADAGLGVPGVRGSGADFDWARPFRMYHGARVPGFPSHPHRGFETLTLVHTGTVDHTDSTGAAGRYGGTGRAADLQWVTAGRGIVHGENFPLVHADRPNPLHLFQIWLNLPAARKMSPPAFQMTWAERMQFVPGLGGAECEVAAGELAGVRSGAAPPHSWAADPANHVGVFYIALPPGGSAFTLPPLPAGVRDVARIARAAYVVEGGTEAAGGAEGGTVTVAGMPVPRGRAHLTLDPQVAVEFCNPHPTERASVLVLQGRPIDEPVAQHGPFVMNTRAEIAQAFADYERTQFGGWPWPQDAVVFPRETGRFAEMVVDGRRIRDEPPLASSPSPAKDEL